VTTHPIEARFGNKKGKKKTGEKKSVKKRGAALKTPLPTPEGKVQTK